MKKILKRTAVVIAILLVFMFFNNSSFFVSPTSSEPLLLAHRGLSQTFPLEGVGNDTCTAERIYEPEHPYLENTIPSMEAAFELGADIVELDIQPTLDGEFAVFHDWTVDCRTDGSGVTREMTMEELEQLDIGYGYTADGGETFPFRGQEPGQIPTLKEVLDTFPEQALLIHIKSNDPTEGDMLADYLLANGRDLDTVTVYGGDEPVARLKELLPDVRVMSKETMKACLVPYLAVGWTGYMPAACENTQLHLPETIAKWLWGWPTKFVNRMDAADTRVILVAGDGGFSEGFDSKEDAERIPPDYHGGIWTNRIDKLVAE
ncbi:glycerophosphodiester phosphodiesterase [Alkalihalobacillus oceani]|uniref:Glycerophosphodiester phosphodiesterase n=1 Tax=Halalkalibacter oceani TaxID=1653776 RepID=A0A9X2INF8_9BACI|nr:glycerophosphodiester phosphodiesterase family protein [Halalkalibacter oceani]MCM3713751.1 glycerophosphodiester phosphodiesterase [Halalkalibacter oceani]